MPSLPMPATDSMFLLGETPTAPMHVGLLEVFDKPDAAPVSFVKDIYDDIVTQTDLAPVWRRRPTRGLLTAGQWAWEDDDDIDLRHHLRHSALPMPGRPRELFELTGRLHGTHLDRHRPLWEAHIVEGMTNDRFAVYSKQHHALMDGVSGMRTALRSLSPDPAEHAGSPWADHARSRKDAADDAAGGPLALVGQAVGLAGDLASLAGDVAGLGPAVLRAVYNGLTDQVSSLPFQAPRTILNATITGSRRFAGQSWSMERIRAVASGCGGTVNDVVLAMCSGALRAYLSELDALPDAPLVAMVPVSLASEGSGGGNSVGVILCNLGTHLDSAGARLEMVHASMEHGKASLEGLSPLQVIMLSAASMAPLLFNPTLKAHTFTRPPFNLVISNVPGSSEQLYWNGARLSGLYPLSIPLDGQALNITVCSHHDQLGFGLVGCRRTVPRLQRMLGQLDDELTALEEAVKA